MRVPRGENRFSISSKYTIEGLNHVLTITDAVPDPGKGKSNVSAFELIWLGSISTTQEFLPSLGKRE